MKERNIEYLKEIVSHMDFEVVDLGENRVRIISKEQRFDLVFDDIESAIDFVTDIN